MERILSHRELRIYKFSFELAMRTFELSKSFPNEEKFSLTNQIRRSSWSVSGNISEAWRKRRYPKSFVSKLSDSEAEAAETQNWLDFALACNYIYKNKHQNIDEEYNHVLSMLVKMINKPEQWKV